jgi:NAD(P)-dependent dehydrogenase (short-subunit alcohol dehydrogenase family)
LSTRRFAPRSAEAETDPERRRRTVELAGKVVVVTGGANGIGRALVQRFVAEGAAAVTVVDRDSDGVAAVTEALGERTHGLTADVSVEADIRHVVDETERRSGPIDLFCSNAGIAGGGDIFATDEEWNQIWAVNLMAHVYAARAVLPGMLDRGEGYLLQTASAAGLLTNIGNCDYSVTKHAAVGLAEWLAITYGDRGIKVSCLCPQGVRTNMLMGAERDPAGATVLSQGAVEPAVVADAVVEGLREERFLILPHPEVADYWRRKADDPDRWLAGMRRLQARILSELGDAPS